MLWWHCDHASPPPAQDIPRTFKWLHWAAGLPRLRLVELWVSSAMEKYSMLCPAVRAEGESTSVEGMLQRLLWDVARAFCA